MCKNKRQVNSERNGEARERKYESWKWYSTCCFLVWFSQYLYPLIIISCDK